MYYIQSVMVQYFASNLASCVKKSHRNSVEIHVHTTGPVNLAFILGLNPRQNKLYILRHFINVLSILQTHHINLYLVLNNQIVKVYPDCRFCFIVQFYRFYIPIGIQVFPTNKNQFYVRETWYCVVYVTIA